MSIDIAKELKYRNRPPDIARICFSLLVLILSRKYPVISMIMLCHLFMSVVWIVIDEKNPYFQRDYPGVWLIPSSLDIFNSLMIIYITGSVYSSWILSLPFMTAFASSDVLRWRGLYSCLAGSIGLAILLFLVQFEFLPYLNLWDSIDIIPPIAVIVQTILLNFIVSLSVWASVRFNAVTMATIAIKAAVELGTPEEQLHNLLPKEITNQLDKHKESS